MMDEAPATYEEDGLPRVREYLRVHTITVSPDESLREIIMKLDLYQVQLLPVIDETGAVLGVVSEHDIMSLVIEWRNEVSSVLSVLRRSQVTAKDIMTSPALVVKEDASLQTAWSLLHSKQIKRLPVTLDGKLVGTIGRRDILAAYLEEDPDEGVNSNPG